MTKFVVVDAYNSYILYVLDRKILIHYKFEWVQHSHVVYDLSTMGKHFSCFSIEFLFLSTSIFRIPEYQHWRKKFKVWKINWIVLVKKAFKRRTQVWRKKCYQVVKKHWNQKLVLFVYCIGINFIVFISLCKIKLSCFICKLTWFIGNQENHLSLKKLSGSYVKY